MARARISVSFGKAYVIMVPRRLSLWHMMIQVGAGWWFLEQGGHVPGFSSNEMASPIIQNESRANSSLPQEETAHRTWSCGGSLPWWTGDDPNVSPPSSGGWFVLGFRFGGARIFSTPDHGASLQPMVAGSFSLWTLVIRLLTWEFPLAEFEITLKPHYYLCKSSDCQGGLGVHHTSYDAVDGRVCAWRPHPFWC